MIVQVGNLLKTVKNVEDVAVQSGHYMERTIDSSESFLKVCMLYSLQVKCLE